MFLDWVSFLAYPNLFGIKGFVVVVVVIGTAKVQYSSKNEIEKRWVPDE
jgi:hypothetical protein